MNILEKARLFAHAAHDAKGQKRKYTGESYWVHTDAVASLVLNVVLPTDGTFDGNFQHADNMIVAAHLHDTLEDTDETASSLLAAGFSMESVKLIVELTNMFTKEAYPHWTRQKRKEAEAERQSRMSDDAKTIKLADIYDNTKDLLKHDLKFAKIYLEEKQEALKGLAGGNFTLYRKTVHQVYQAKETLDKMVKI